MYRVKKTQASLTGERAGIHPQDRKLTERARNLLVNNMGKLLTLEKLAENVGMSHPKLNSCFKQLYGMTVFQYLRATRLSRARYLLHVEGLSVTEVL